MNPIITFDHAIEEYRCHLLSEFRSRGWELDRARFVIWWRGADPPFTGFFLSGDGARCAVGSDIYAVVAQVYVLIRDQCAHILCTCHSSFKDAPPQCLAAFDELQYPGLEAFTKKNDPYWDIPLNKNLPQLVIDLPIPKATPDAAPTRSHKELLISKPPPLPRAAARCSASNQW